MTTMYYLICFTGCCRTAFSRTIVCCDILTCSLSFVLEISLISILECSLITSCSPLGCWELRSWACCVIITWSLVGFKEKDKITFYKYLNSQSLCMYELIYETIFEWNGVRIWYHVFMYSNHTVPSIWLLYILLVFKRSLQNAQNQIPHKIKRFFTVTKDTWWKIWSSNHESTGINGGGVIMMSIGVIWSGGFYREPNFLPITLKWVRMKWRDDC